MASQITSLTSVYLWVIAEPELVILENQIYYSKGKANYRNIPDMCW